MEAQKHDAIHELEEVAGVFVDAALADREGGLLFLSAYGRDTSIQELISRLSLPEKDGGLDAVSYRNEDGRQVRYRVNRDLLDKLTGRVPGTVFGDLVHIYVYDKLCEEPDPATRRAMLMQPGHGETLDQLAEQRLWPMVQDVCHLPLLDHWRDTVLQALHHEGLVERLEGLNVSALRVTLPPEHMEPLMTELARDGRVTLDEADQPPPKAAAPAENWDVIHSYTRADALTDGVLVDVTDTAREAGFKIPVAVTQAVWEDCVAWSDADNAGGRYQDQRGRLWDVVYMAFLRAKAAPGQSVINVPLWRIPREPGCNDAEEIALKMQCGPGDSGEPVITLMQPHED